MKKVILTLGLAILVASCTGPSIEGVEHVNSISQGEGYYPVEVVRYKLDGKHDYLLIYTKSTRDGVCHDPECAYCKMNPSTGNTSSNSSDDWTW